MELFKKGYNCAQAVCAAFADMYGYTEEQALRMSASFGGGIGRMRMTCGAACGMFLLAGLQTGSVEAADRKSREENYRLVRQLAEEFARRNGSLICAELLGLDKKENGPALPGERAVACRKKRSCVEMVGEVARIWVEYREKFLREKSSFV